MIVCRHILRRLAQRAFGFAVAKLLQQGVADGSSQFVLQLEDIFQRAVVAFRPDMAVMLGVDQLRGQPDAIAGLAHAAFQNELDAEFLRDLPEVGRLALVSKSGVARNDEQVPLPG